MNISKIRGKTDIARKKNELKKKWIKAWLRNLNRH